MRRGEAQVLKNLDQVILINEIKPLFKEVALVLLENEEVESHPENERKKVSPLATNSPRST